MMVSKEGALYRYPDYGNARKNTNALFFFYF